MNEVMRQEKKYAINLADGSYLRARLGGVMIQDAHNGASGYAIRSLYFDTLDDQDFKEKIDGLELRRKVRLRIYSPDADSAKLEIKQKQGPYQKKRSLQITREDALLLCQGNYSPLLRYRDPFAAECYGLMTCRCYRPKAIVEYRRQPLNLAMTCFPPACPSALCWSPTTWCWRSNTTAFCSAISGTC